MKPGRDSKRRRLSSPNRLFGGIITRSRAEIFLHRSRSGRARPDPSRRQFFSSFGNIRQSESSSGSCINVLSVPEGISHSSVKDLRARRIFSPASVPAVSLENVEQKIGGNPAVANLQLRRGDELDFGGGFSEVNMGNGNSEGNEAMHQDGEVFSKFVHEKPVNMGSDEAISNCGELRFQTTPPDSDLCKSEAEEVAHNVDLGESILNVSIERERANLSATGVASESLVSSIRGGCVSMNKEHPYDYGNRLQLIPCPRRKLFRNSNSLSYRRLLPYLMGVSPDNACHSENLSSKSQSPVKLHKHAGEDLKLSNSDSVAEENDVNSEKMSHLRHLSGNLKTSLTENFTKNDPTIALFSSPDGLVGLGEKADTKFSGKHVVNELALTPPYIHYDGSSLVDESMLKYSDGHESEICTQSPSTPDKSPQVLATQDPQELSFKVQEGIKGPFLAPTKGILKTNPQRCRGFCDCLSCSHFRLNAEKSYDFCRKQMLNTEQVVMGLLKEMSHLRSVMEKRLEPPVHGASDSCLHPPQDEGICKRVHRAEDLARARLRQMVQNVNIHCKIMRLQRPRVAFADLVEEKLIFEG
ncbi:uncharacterized protein [Aristolochia californica]|uniref:uncharacterized protein isoform X2 n=1 Tax=Aristolochia californica TaxID=171875 RepID=UPI0035D69502